MMRSLQVDNFYIADCEMKKVGDFKRVFFFKIKNKKNWDLKSCQAQNLI